MRHRAFDLAAAENQLMLLISLPIPQQLIGILLWHGVGEFPHYLLVDLWPKLHQRHRSVEAHVKRFIIRIVKTLHKCEQRMSLGISACGPSPKGAGVREYVKLIEKGSAVPHRLTLVIDIRRLPGIDRVAPRACVLQAFGGNLRSILTRGAKEIGVMPIPFPAFTELHEWQVPSHNHGHDALFAWLQRKAHSDCAGENFATAD